jgi:transposase
MQFQAFVACEVPRADCDEHGVLQIMAPSADSNGRDDAAAQAALDVLDMKQKASVEAVAADMWVPFKNAVESQLPNAVLVHDRFHVMGYLTKALDKVRKKEHGS